MGVSGSSSSAAGPFDLTAEDYSKVISALGVAFGAPRGEQLQAFRAELRRAGFEGAKMNTITALTVGIFGAQKLASFAAQAWGSRNASAAQPAAVVVGAGEDCYCGGGYFDQGVRGGGLREMATQDPVQSLVAYSQSESAAAKEGLIRATARVLKDMGLSKIDPEGDLAEVVKTVKEEIPNPARGQNFKAEAASQAKVCEALAKLFNARFTPGAAGKARLINGESPGEVCQQVAAIAGSFMAASSIEFLETYESSQRALETLKLITESLAAVEHELDTKVVASGDSELLRKTAADRDIAAALRAELRRAVVMMENILQVELPPVKAILAKYIREKEGENHRIASVVARLGTSDFSDGISAALLGLGSAGGVAALVSSSLAALGMKTKEFLESPSIGALRAKVRERAKSDPELLTKYLLILEKLTKVFAVRGDPDVRAAIEAAGDGAGAAAGVVGGGPPKSSVAKQIERVKDEKLVLMRAFSAELEGAYNSLVRAVGALVPKIGAEIPITEATDRLRDAFSRLAESASSDKPIEAALVGVFNDADARERKGRFLASLGLISSACAELADKAIFGSAKDSIAALRGAIDEISRIVDSYSGAMERKFGGGAGDGLSSVTTGVQSLTRLLNEAVNHFSYKYFAAKVQENLTQTTSEIGLYAEKYEALLGDAIAARLYAVSQERNQSIRELDPSADLRARGNLGGPSALRAADWLPDRKDDAEPRLKARETILAEVQAMYDAKAKFYRVLQAIDLYLKAFAEGIASDPSAVRRIKTMLDDTPVIARWFSDLTGDKIVDAFERFPAAGGGFPAATAAPNANGAAIRVDGGEDHYYEKINRRCSLPGGNYRLGIPSLGLRPAAGVEAKRSLHEAVDNFQALKNLVSAFTRIGDEFGGKSLREGVFMSPSEIYRDLVSYIKASALETNLVFGAAAAPGVDVAALAGGALSRVQGAVQAYEVHAPQAAQTSRFFAQEDEHFVRILKAMAAKVLVTLGVYDLFERTVPKFDLTPTRMILGGGVGGLDTPDEDAEPITEAAELYFRLPRLAEFYRSFLSWDGEDKEDVEDINGDPHRIAMLPEVEGVFSGLISLVFVRASDPASGTYSEVEMKAMIAAINKIYRFFAGKEPERPIKAALSAFVVEVNRRFGLVKAKDIKEYWELIRLSRRDQATSASSVTDYGILPGESADTVTRRAPSDRFSSVPFQRLDPGTGRPIDQATGNPIDPYEGRVGLHAGGRNLISSFWKKLGRALMDGRDMANGHYSFSGHIRQAETQLGRASGDERLKVVFDLIQEGSLEKSTTDRLLLFGETVVSGLNTLSALETVLSLVDAQYCAMDPVRLEAAIIDSLELASGRQSLVENAAVPLAGAPVVNDKATLAQLIALVLPEMTVDAGSHTICGGKYLVEDNDTFESRIISGAFGAPASLAYACCGRLAAVNGAAAVRNMSASGLWTVADAPLRPSRFFHSPDGGDDPFPAKHQSDLLETKVADAAGGVRIGKVRMVSRLLVDYPQIMKDFIELTSALTSEGGVALRYTRLGEGRAPLLQLDFSALKQKAEALMRDVKANFELMRPYLPKTIVDRFEKKDYAGSIYWLEDKLFDTRLRGSMDASRSAKRSTVEWISRKANSVLRGLLRKTNVDFRPAGVSIDVNDYRNLGNEPRNAYDAADAWGSRVSDAPGVNPGRIEHYGVALSGLLHWDAYSFGQSAGLGDMDMGLGVCTMADALAPEMANLESLVRRTTVAAPGMLQPGLSPPDVDYHRVNIWGSRDVGPARSAVFVLNQLIANFLDAAVDSSTKKIYQPLLDCLTNGVLSEAVSSPDSQGFPDIRARGLLGVGLWGDPKPTGILVQSLALVMQRLSRDTVGQAMTPKHLVQTLTEVPLYMKEKFRAGLPVHIALFEALQRKCEFVRDLLQNAGNSCSLARPAAVYNLHRNDVANTMASVPELQGDMAAAGAAAPALPAFGAPARAFAPVRARPAHPFGLAFDYAAGEITQAPRPVAPGAAPMPNFGILRIQNEVLTPSAKYVLAGGGVNGLHPLGGDTDATVRTRIYDELNAILSVCYAVAGAANGVLRELADNPVFLQSQEGAIEQFTMRTGRRPLMPPSLALAVLGDVRLAVEAGGGGAPEARPRTRHLAKPNLFSTGLAVNGADHRLLYGIRGAVLGKKPVDVDLFPWLYQFLAEEAPSSFSSKLPDKIVVSAVSNTMGVLRWLVGIRHIASQVSSDSLPLGFPIGPAGGALSAFTLFNPQGGSGLSNNPDSSLRVFALAGGLSHPAPGAVIGPTSSVDILSVVENTNESGAKQKLIGGLTALSGVPTQNTREAQRIANLVDMNVMPVNVHALMRDIPLANLHNYSEAFTRIIGFALGVSEEPPAVEDGRTFLLKFLVDPFRAIAPIEYGVLADAPGEARVARMLCGTDGTGMGRPRFLSDQLWNKVLLCSVYSPRQPGDESGPSIPTRSLVTIGDLRMQIAAIAARISGAIQARLLPNNGTVRGICIVMARMLREPGRAADVGRANLRIAIRNVRSDLLQYIGLLRQFHQIARITTPSAFMSDFDTEARLAVQSVLRIVARPSWPVNSVDLSLPADSARTAYDIALESRIASARRIVALRTTLTAERNTALRDLQSSLDAARVAALASLGSSKDAEREAALQAARATAEATLTARVNDLDATSRSALDQVKAEAAAELASARAESEAAIAEVRKEALSIADEAKRAMDEVAEATSRLESVRESDEITLAARRADLARAEQELMSRREAYSRLAGGLSARISNATQQQYTARKKADTALAAANALRQTATSSDVVKILQQLIVTDRQLIAAGIEQGIARTALDRLLADASAAGYESDDMVYRAPYSVPEDAGDDRPARSVDDGSDDAGTGVDARGRALRRRMSSDSDTKRLALDTLNTAEGKQYLGSYALQADGTHPYIVEADRAAVAAFDTNAFVRDAQSTQIADYTAMLVLEREALHAIAMRPESYLSVMGVMAKVYRNVVEAKIAEISTSNPRELVAITRTALADITEASRAAVTTVAPDNRSDFLGSLSTSSIYLKSPSEIYEEAVMQEAIGRITSSADAKWVATQLRRRAVVQYILQTTGAAEPKLGGVDPVSRLLQAAGVTRPGAEQDLANDLARLAPFIAMGSFDMGAPDHASFIESVLAAPDADLPRHFPSESERFNAYLTYMEDSEIPANVVKKIKIAGKTAATDLTLAGYSRFNTTIIRKLIFIAQLQRVIRQQLSRKLTHERDVLRSSHAGVAPEVTEYGFDPYSANEVATSRPRGLNYGVSPGADGKWTSGEGRWLDGK